jgi:hypothetical protein
MRKVNHPAAVTRVTRSLCIALLTTQIISVVSRADIFGANGTAADEAGLAAVKTRGSVDQILAKADQAALELKFDDALKLTNEAVPLAKRLKDPDWDDAIGARLKDLRAAQTEYRRLQTVVFERIKKEPDNKSLNLAVGRFYGMTLGNWDEALPHLANGSDPELKELAAADLDASTAEEHAKAGDRWMDHAAKEKAEGTKIHFRERAARCYASADKLLSASADQTTSLLAHVRLQLVQGGGGPDMMEKITAAAETIPPGWTHEHDQVVFIEQALELFPKPGSDYDLFLDFEVVGGASRQFWVDLPGAGGASYRWSMDNVSMGFTPPAGRTKVVGTFSIGRRYIVAVRVRAELLQVTVNGKAAGQTKPPVGSSQPEQPNRLAIHTGGARVLFHKLQFAAATRVPEIPKPGVVVQPPRF